MPTTVVCISQTDGADGGAVGIAVASELGYRYVDRELVARAAEKASVDPETIADVERRKSFVRRLLQGLPTSLTAVRESPVEFHPGDVPTETWDLRDVIRSVIADLAQEGRVVIVSHAASMALAGDPNVLRVLVTASATTRIQRISRAGTWLTHEGAALAIRDSDHARQDYFRRFYGVNQEETTHYDLVLNTDLLTAERAAVIVCAAARSAGA